MAKKHYEDFEEEFIEDEEFEDLEDDFIDDEEFEDEIEDVKPSKKTKKAKKDKPKKKSKLSKGKKVGITLGTIFGVVAIVLVAIFVIMPMLTKSATVKVVPYDEVNVSSLLNDVGVAPSDSVKATVRYDVQSILDNDSYSDSYKAAAALLFATGNEVFCNQYTWFRSQIGSTDLGSNSGTLIYQRLRRETTDMKYDTTLKYPVNHNFNAIAVGFVTDAAIRYIREDGQYFRFKADGDFKYDEETGVVHMDKWTKHSNKHWNREGPTQNDVGGYLDLIKINADMGELGNTIEESTVNDSLIDASTVKIIKNEETYTIKFSIDATKANADSKTTKSLDESNGGTGIKYDYCHVEIEMWHCGLNKSVKVNEKWNGKIVAYSGAAVADSLITYSYSDADCLDVELPNKLIAEIGA